MSWHTFRKIDCDVAPVGFIRADGAWSTPIRGDFWDIIHVFRTSEDVSSGDHTYLIEMRDELAFPVYVLDHEKIRMFL